MLRYFQRECIDATMAALKGFRSCLINLPTGAGKNVVASTLIGQHKQKRCLYLGDAEELILQPIKALGQFAGIIPAVERAKDRASLNAGTVVGSVQTMRKKDRLERFPRDHFDLIVADEAHRMSPAKAEIFDHFETAKVIGMTATPFRANMADLSKWYETVAYMKPLMDLIGEGFAPPIERMILPIEVDLEKVKSSMSVDGKDYKPEDCSAAIEPYFEAAAELLAQHAKRRFTIAYLPLVKSSQAFASILRQHGMSAMHVDGASPDREEIFEAFSRGRFQVLCNAGVCSTGVDLPIADTFLNLQPMHSAALYQQRVGRVMRVLPGVIDDLPEKAQAPERKDNIEWSDKPFSLLFDILWQHDRLGVMRPESLVCDNPEDAQRVFARAKKDMTAEDLQELHKRVQEDKEYQLIQAIERAACKSDSRKGVQASEAGVLFGNHSLTDYTPVARWEMDKPSEAQLTALCRFSIDIASVKSKGHAKALMDELVFRATHNLATTKQLRYIYRINADRLPEDKIPHPERLNFTEASAAIEAEIGRKHAKKIEQEFARV